jgi:hypothetical protein
MVGREGHAETEGEDKNKGGKTFGSNFEFGLLVQPTYLPYSLRTSYPLLYILVATLHPCRMMNQPTTVFWVFHHDIYATFILF